MRGKKKQRNENEEPENVLYIQRIGERKKVDEGWNEYENYSLSKTVAVKKWFQFVHPLVINFKPLLFYNLITLIVLCFNERIFFIISSSNSADFVSSCYFLPSFAAILRPTKRENLLFPSVGRDKNKRRVLFTLSLSLFFKSNFNYYPKHSLLYPSLDTYQISV